MAAECLAELAGVACRATLTVDGRRCGAACSASCSTQRAVRPPYGGHPRIFIWGLLEARLQRADLVVLGGLNEGVWPALARARPVAAAQGARRSRHADARHRIGLAAHDFASALGAPEVLITRARRDGRSPTVASRFLLRLEAISGGLPRDLTLERLTARARRSGAAAAGRRGPRRRRPPSSGPTGSRSPRSTG